MASFSKVEKFPPGFSTGNLISVLFRPYKKARKVTSNFISLKKLAIIQKFYLHMASFWVIFLALGLAQAGF